MNLESRTPPHNRDAEQSVIGSMLRDNSVIPDVTLILPPAQAEELFYDPSLAILYGQIVKLSDEKKNVDLVLLAQSLHDSGQVEDVGGHTRLAAIYDETPTAANATYYAEIVAELSSRRRYIRIGNEIVREATNPCEPGKLPEFTESLIIKASAKQSGSKTEKLCKEYQEVLDRLDNPEPQQPGYPTGIISIDVMFSIEPGSLTTVGASPSVGKSMLLGQMADTTSQMNLFTLFFALEMRRIEMAERFLSLRSGVLHSKLRGIQLADENEALKIAQAYHEVYYQPIEFNCEVQTLTNIKAEARRAKIRNNLKVMFIDYLQLVEPEESKGKTRAEAIGVITRGLKALANELDIAVVIASQLNRAAEDRSEPRLSDLRESGSIEQDSTNVILLWLDEKEETKVRGKIAKQRNGPTAYFELTRNAAFMRFEGYQARTSFKY